MSKRNSEYDFVWCPGCGDFGVRRALEFALTNYTSEHEKPYNTNVIVAGIGCSGNMVHLIEGDQPFGIHGIHGRTLPIALGIKSSRPDLNTIIVAGDGDFLSIGAEHIGPAAQRNLNVTCIIMDNGVYGLTKGQSSPTSDMGKITTSTPYGKIEVPVSPLNYYMTVGVSYIASYYSSKPKILANFIKDISSETPDVQSYLFVKDNISKYKLNIDINSKAIKNKMIEVNTILKFEDKESNEKKSYFEITYASIVKINESVKEKKELEKIIICDVQNIIYPKLEKAFINLLNDSGFPNVKMEKKIDFNDLYNKKFN